MGRGKFDIVEKRVEKIPPFCFFLTGICNFKIYFRERETKSNQISIERGILWIGIATTIFAFIVDYERSKQKKNQTNQKMKKKSLEMRFFKQ